jgi:metallo-beta-lactamase family protein
VDGIEKVRILGEKRSIKAKIVRIHGFSAHADRNELLDWLKEMKAPPKGVFVIHGETESANSFGQFVKEHTGWQVSVPEYQDEIILD